MKQLDIPVELLKCLPIKQQIFGVEQRKELLEIAGSNYEEQINNYPYHQIIYIKLEKPVPITLMSGYKSFNKNIPTFKQCLLQLPEVNYHHLLFITSFYPVIDAIKLTDIIQSHQKRVGIPILEQWLGNSFGLLVYAHQLEQLYCMLSGCNYMEAITFRKDWNLKRPKSREVADSLQISSDTYLSDFMQQNSIEPNQFVYNANFSGAFKLWQHICQLKANDEQSTKL